ncbi:MAG: class IV adenylate cyclase [Rubripirellula sp.]
MSPPETMPMYEVEQKFHVDDLAALESRLTELNAIEGAVQQHEDIYYNHPSRDFAESQEAFRVRRVDGVPMITYKGQKLPGEVKARRELEWRLDPGDSDGMKTEELLSLLSFPMVATVTKQRRCFSIGQSSGQIAVVIDTVDCLGLFAEIELVVSDSSEVEAARRRIVELGTQLGLLRTESRSYLRMILMTN